MPRESEVGLPEVLCFESREQQKDGQFDCRCIPQNSRIDDAVRGDQEGFAHRIEKRGHGGRRDQDKSEQGHSAQNDHPSRSSVCSTRPTPSTMHAMSASEATNAGASAIVSPETRSTKSSSAKARVRTS